MKYQCIRCGKITKNGVLTNKYFSGQDLAVMCEKCCKELNQDE